MPNVAFRSRRSGRVTTVDVEPTYVVTDMIFVVATSRLLLHCASRFVSPKVRAFREFILDALRPRVKP